MPIFETFSKRQKKRELAGQPDVYQYDSLPEPFRVQIIHIWCNAIGFFDESDPYYTMRPLSSSNEWWRGIHDALAREKGVFSLTERRGNPFAQCQRYLLDADTDGALDIIELTFRFIDSDLRHLSEYEQEKVGITQDAEDAIQELNYRFREHGIGYQYVEGQLVKIDSQYIHQEVIKPAISLLHDVGFQGASEEFLRAHEHYRKGRPKEAIAEALKAFESTMKAICDARKWQYPANATAKPLIDIVFKNGLIPAELESHFGGLRSAMESGLPTISNKTSRHGQGTTPMKIPEHFAAYALHLAGSNIVFLVEAHKLKK